MARDPYVVFVGGAYHRLKPEKVAQVLNRLAARRFIDQIVQLGANNPDTPIAKWAKNRACKVRTPPAALPEVEVFAEAHPDLVLLFPGGLRRQEIEREAIRLDVPVEQVAVA